MLFISQRKKTEFKARLQEEDGSVDLAQAEKTEKVKMRHGLNER